MVTLSSLTKENQNLNLRGKKCCLLLKMEINGGLWLENSTFSNKLIFFSVSLSFDFSWQGNSG